MSSAKLSLIPVDDFARWDALVASSSQGTLFSEKFYLEAVGCSHHLYWVKQGTGTEIKAGVALVVSEDGKRCVLDDLVIYGGLLYDLDASRQVVKRRHDEFQIAEFVIEQLAERYEAIDVQLSPAVQDMRPFLWYRYHEAAENKFQLDLRYTSYVDIASLPQYQGREEESPCYQAMETVRRYSVREAAKKGGSVVVAENGERLIEYYTSLMQSQGEAPPALKLTGMANVMRALLERGRGAIYHVLNASGDVIYCACYGWDAKRAYYLFGAGHPEISEPWQGTLVHWEAFKEMAIQKGITEVDMEGVNSPQRGWFKLGFAGDLRPYYRVVKF